MNVKEIKEKIGISSEDKVYFPESGITKGELVEYFIKISDVMLPHVKGRPMNMHRYPNGIEGKGFFQQEIPDHFPDWVKRIKIERKQGGSIEHVECNDVETLAYIANQGGITQHIWLSKSDNYNNPDKMIFDLDPPGENFKPVIETARRIRKYFQDEFDTEMFLMTTGSSGLHIVLPLKPDNDFDTVRDTAQKIAKILADKYPDDMTTEVRKNKRQGRIYLDVARNAYGQTSVAPYSVRAKEGAPVAAPLDWDELSKKNIGPRLYNIKNIFRRLSQKEDPWKDFYRRRKSLKRIKEDMEKKL